MTRAHHLKTCLNFCRDFVRAEDLPEPPRKIARTAAKKKDGVQASSNRPPMADAIATGLSKSQKDITDQKELQLALVETSEAKVPFTEGVPLEDLVQMVKDEKLGGHESNTAGGVRTRVVMRRNSDGRAAQLVEDIRQQMISAAGHGASDDLGKVAVSDDKFFAAFKVIIFTFLAVKSLDIHFAHSILSGVVGVLSR